MGILKLFFALEGQELRLYELHLSVEVKHSRRRGKKSYVVAAFHSEIGTVC